MPHLHEDAQTSFRRCMSPSHCHAPKFFFRHEHHQRIVSIDLLATNCCLGIGFFFLSLIHIRRNFAMTLHSKLSESFQELSSLACGYWINISHCRFERQILSIQYSYPECGWRQGLGATMTIAVKASFLCRKALPSPGHVIPMEHTNEDQEDFGCD